MDCYITITPSGKASRVLANNGKESELFTSLLSVPFIENGVESIDLYGKLIALDFLKEKHIQDDNGEPKLYFMAGNSNVNPLFESFANAKAAYPNSPIVAGFAKHGKLQEYNNRSYAPMNQFTPIASFANILSDGNTKNDIINNLIVTGAVKGKMSWKMKLRDKVKSYSEPLRFSAKSSQQDFIRQAIQRNNGNPLNLAPNGKPSILYQSYKDLGYSDSEAERLVSQVYSDEFISWFGDWIDDTESASKVIDENGQPMIVHHGTGEVFNEFINFSNRHYFSSENIVAESYVPENGNIVSSFLNIKTPKTIDYNYRNWDYKRIKGYIGKDSVDIVANIQELNTNDGVILYNIKDPGLYTEDESFGNNYIAFNSNQIKSATENIGTFSSSNNDIRFNANNKRFSSTSNTAKAVTEYLKSKGFPLNILSEQQMIEEARKLGYDNFSEVPQTLTKNERIYGFYNPQNNQIYLTDEVMNSDTLVHELFHWYHKPLQAQAASGNKTAEALLKRFDELSLKVLGGESKLKEYFDGASKSNQPKSLNFSNKNNFERWKGGNQLVEGSELQDIKSGTPIVVRAYHGTTNEFYEFDSSVKGSIEGHLGKVNYFTTDYQDASMNYLADGKDLTNRIEQLSDRIGSDLQELSKEDVLSQYNITDEEYELYINESEADLAEFIAKKELNGGTEQVLDLYVKLNNPVVLGNGATWFETLNISEEDLEQAAQEIAEENDITVEEAKQDYEWDIKDRSIENTGYEKLATEALSDALRKNGYDSNKAFEILGDNLYDTEIDLNKLEQDLRKAELYENESGEMASSQVIADFFKNLGFDGIILTDVSNRFKNMNLGENTSHIHVFDEFNNQIKLANGSNVNFGETSDIRYATSSSPFASEVYAPRQNETFNAYKDRMMEEAIARLLGENSTDYFERIAKEAGLNDKETKSFLEKVKQFILDFADWLGTQLGLTDVTPEQIASMTNKEMFNKVITSMLRGDYLEKTINQQIKDITNGQAVFKRFSQEEHRGFLAGGEHHVAATILAQRIRGASEEDSTEWEAQAEKAIEDYAKENNIWVENLKRKFGEPQAIGAEAYVWFSPKNSKVTKAIGHSIQNGLDNLLDRITIHNYLFPQSNMKVVGFAKDTRGDFNVLIEQPFIKAESTTSPAVRNYMANLGFKESDDYSLEDIVFSNSDYILQDLHLGNVLKTPKGNLIVIDGIFYLNTPSQGYGGNRGLDNSIQYSNQLNNDIRFSIIGERAASNVENYKKSLEEAKLMESNGASPIEIESKTKWYKYQGQWRTLSNEAIRAFKDIKIPEINKKTNLKTILGNESILFKMYPTLGRINVTIVGKNNSKIPKKIKDALQNGNALYASDESHIYINSFYQHYSDEAEAEARGLSRRFNTLLIHEVQHIIQKEENMPKGGELYTLLQKSYSLLKLDVDSVSFGQAKEAIINRDKSKFSSEDNKVLDRAISNIDAILSSNMFKLEYDYDSLLGEVDASIAEEALRRLYYSEDNFESIYSRYLNDYLFEKNMTNDDILSIYESAIQLNIVGEIGAANLDDSLQTMDNLAIAKEMLAKNKSPKAIKNATGWEYSAPENKWKLELDYGTTKNLPRLREIAANESFSRKHVNNISYKLNGDNTYDVKMYNTESGGGSEGRKIEYSNMTKEDLTTMLGSDLANDIISEKGVDITEDWGIIYGEYAEKAFEINKKYPMSTGNAIKLSSIFVALELFKAFPKLNNLDVVVSPLKSGEAAWDGENIILTPQSAMKNDKYIRSILIHEVQHFIQEQEGFARGGTSMEMQTEFTYEDEFILGEYADSEKSSSEFLADPNVKYLLLESHEIRSIIENKTKLEIKLTLKDAKLTSSDKYKRLAGEVEARNVQARAEMSKAKRLKTLLSETEDIAPEDKIYLYGSTMASSESPLKDKIIAKRKELAKAELRKQKFEENIAKNTTQQLDMFTPNVGQGNLLEIDKTKIQKDYQAIKSDVARISSELNTLINESQGVKLNPNQLDLFAPLNLDNTVKQDIEFKIATNPKYIVDALIQGGYVQQDCSL